MPNKLVAILLCLVLANVVNYAVNKWLDSSIPGWLPPQSSLDGSSLSTSMAYADLLEGTLPATETNAAPLTKVLVPYYQYLAEGGGENWLAWRSAYDAGYSNIVIQAGNERDQQWRSNLLTMVDRTALAKYSSLFLLFLTILLFYGGLLKEQYWWTPLAYTLLVAGTAAIYSFFAAPLFLVAVVGGFVVYALALRLSLPIYTYEWTKSLRPFLTYLVFLLLMMAIRGPEWIDYLFWTSQLYRLALVSILLLTLFFHLSILDHNLRNAKLGLTSRIMGYCMPLGITAIFLGLFLGFYAAGDGGSLFALNQEVLLYTPSVVEGFRPEGTFILFFAGVALLITGGIGFSIQQIAE